MLYKHFFTKIYRKTTQVQVRFGKIHRKRSQLTTNDITCHTIGEPIRIEQFRTDDQSDSSFQREPLLERHSIPIS